jgi:TonB family protein
MSLALQIIAKTTILLLGAACAGALLRRASAAVRHAMWVLALTASMLLPLPVKFIPRLDLPVLPDNGISVTFLQVGQALAVTTPDPTLKPAAAGRRPNWLLLSESIWALGTVLLLLRFAVGAAAVRRMSRRSVPMSSDIWGKLVEELSATIGIRRPVLLLSGGETSPMTWGVLRHTILLPLAAETWPEERQRVVLAHELAHVKRRDGLVQLFVQVACSIYWFNPLVWYAAHRIRIERERACDDHVLLLGNPAADYADHLVQIVRGLQEKRDYSLAAVSMAMLSQLETRLKSILDSRVSRLALSRPGLLVLCIFTGLVTVSVAIVDITAAVALPRLTAASPIMAALPPAATESKPAPTPQRVRIGNAGAFSNNPITPPRVLTSVPPLYTPEAVAANVEGTVTLEAAVDVEGKVTVLRVIKGLGYGLDTMARKAVLGWKFSPALRDGQPVETVTQIDVEFKIPQSVREFTLKITQGGQEDPSQTSRARSEAPAGAKDDMLPIKMGPGVSPPLVIFRVEPQYTQEARDAKLRGTVVVSAVIHQDGSVTVDHVVQPLEYGLTENANAALELWRFRPASRDGRPVPILVNVEVNFNLQ